MNHDDNHETLAAVYALGALDGEDLAIFERHLEQGCARCSSLLRDSTEVLVGLAAPAPVAPPPEIKTRLLERIAATPVTAPVPPAAVTPLARARPRRSPWVPWVAGAVAAALVAALTATFVASRYEGYVGQVARDLSRRYETRLTEATAENSRLRNEVTALRDQLGVYRSAAELLRDPATRVVDLRGLGPSPAATARVVWHERTGGHLFVANLPPAPTGKKYELWTIAGKAPRPAGLFQTDQNGQGSARIEPVPDGPVKVFAVTVEPEAGAPAPTGPMVLASR
jgi:anti-sigma-K factor RskA